MDYKNSFEVLKALPEKLPAFQDNQDKWQDPALFAETHDHILSQLDDDLKRLRQDAKFIFSTDDEMRSQTKLCVNMIRGWVLSNEAPSLAALCIFAMENFKVEDAEYIRLPLLASVLGEMENDLSYHSNMHYRKVVLQMIRLIANHNEIYADTSKALSGKQICTLLAAAAIHDLGHDGRTNTIEGVHERARLELHSYDLFQHYAKPLGFDDPALAEVLRVMLLCTDVSPVNDPRSPAAQMKAAYRWHFLGDQDTGETINLSNDLKPLEKSEMLTVMALLLHEADIATSAGLDYAVTKYETGLLRKELSEDTAQPGHVKFFLEKICNRQMLSEAGKHLYTANLARIYALVEQDYQRGNEPYPELMRSDFILGQSLEDFSSSSTSIN